MAMRPRRADVPVAGKPNRIIVAGYVIAPALGKQRAGRVRGSARLSRMARLPVTHPDNPKLISFSYSLYSAAPLPGKTFPSHSQNPIRSVR